MKTVCYMKINSALVFNGSIGYIFFQTPVFYCLHGIITFVCVFKVALFLVLDILDFQICLFLKAIAAFAILF